MLREFEFFLSCILLFISVFGIFNTRWLIRRRVKSDYENRDVLIVRIICYLLAIVSLFMIYLL